MATLFVLFSLLISSSFMITLSQSSTHELCNPRDKKVLLQIKNQLGPTAYYFSTWHPDTDCCRTWFNVGCHNRTHQVNYLTIGLTAEISGQIPEVVGELTGLETLYFNDLPDLTGPIPLAISKLTNLQDLELFHNNLSGPIPGFLGRLKKLTILDLSKNQLSGPIPASLGLLTNLQQLGLDHNQLSGPIPESFGSFKNLVLRAQENRLSGPIPRSLGQTGFYWLNISSNHLTGDASVLFGKDKKAILIELKNNALSFDLSEVEFPSGLRTLDLSHNKIYGSLPKQLASLPLTQFDASYNRVSTFSPYSSFGSGSTADGFGRVGPRNVAVEKESSDPYLDFRQSMLQMIAENEIYSEDELKHLLNCFLQLNSPSLHGVIIRAFTEIWNGFFFSERPSYSSPRFFVPKSYEI